MPIPTTPSPQHSSFGDEMENVPTNVRSDAREGAEPVAKLYTLSARWGRTMRSFSISS